MLSTPVHQGRRRTVAFLVFCVCAYLLCAPGRIAFPDDEIVYQTTAALYERGGLSIPGIPRRTGEPKGEPTGTFGWAAGPRGQRYGFFGHGLSIAALPMYGLGKAAAATAPEAWRHTIRSDHFFVHRRSQHDDWTRLLVSLTNCLLTPLAVLLAMAWTRRLGFSRGAAWFVGVALGFGTLLLPYTRTFLSEPLSTVLLLGAALGLERHHRTREPRWLWFAAFVVGWSCHVHLLNLIAVPAFLGYAFAPRWPERASLKRTWGVALLLGATGLIALGVSQALRFGSPFESGRHGLYSHVVVPGLNLLALLVSPGRSLWWTSPVLLGALLGWRRFRQRVPAAAWFCLAVVVTRMLFVATRSDWWGGWALGPRFLIPIIPFALLPIAAAWDGGTKRLRVGLVLLLSVSVALQIHLAQHSIFEWMMVLYGSTPDDPGYLWVSHWSLEGTPAWGFAQLRPDLLRVGANQLAQAGHPGMSRVFLGISVAAVSSLALALWPGRSRLRGETSTGHAPAR
ncbi:MAG: hypothetical protein ACRBN8_34495 [Nannocystales bacterium]